MVGRGEGGGSRICRTIRWNVCPAIGGVDEWKVHYCQCWTDNKTSNIGWGGQVRGGEKERRRERTEPKHTRFGDYVRGV